MAEWNNFLTSLYHNCNSKYSYPTTNLKKLYFLYSVLICSFSNLLHIINNLYHYINLFSAINQYWLELNHYWRNYYQKWPIPIQCRLTLNQYRQNPKEYWHDSYQIWCSHYQYSLYSNHKWLFKQHLFDIINNYRLSSKYFFYSLDKSFYKLINHY